MHLHIPASRIFRVCLALLIALLVAVGSSAETPMQRPIPLVFDTDLGSDIDDVLALAVIHALESRGECELKAVTISKDDPHSAPFVDAVNTFYGRGDIPIGVVRGGIAMEPSRYTRLARKKDGETQRYPHDLASGDDAPEAVALLRKLLAAERDGSVVVVQVGVSTNLARLLESRADQASELSGVDLVRKKVRLLSVMAGDFSKTEGKPEPEYNVRMDIDSARKVFDSWPTEIVFSGFEVGKAVRFPSASIAKDFNYVPHHPVSEAYVLYSPPPHDRPLWDLTSVLAAVRPGAGYFDISPSGRVRVAKDGATSFQQEADGPHCYLILEDHRLGNVRSHLVNLTTQPPGAFAKNR